MFRKARGTIALGATLAVTATLGCHHPNRVVKELARDDFDCFEDRLVVEALGQGEYRVTGCGKCALYECQRRSRVGPDGSTEHTTVCRQERDARRRREACL